LKHEPWQASGQGGGGGKRAARLSRLKSVAILWCRDETGTIAMLFALMGFVVVALVGGAIDFGRAFTVKEQLQRTVDAASLAAARVWQTENDISLAQQRGTQFFESNKPLGVTTTMAFTTDFARNAIRLDATASVPAPFLTAAYAILRPIGISLETLDVSTFAEAQLAVGGESEQSLEISMMLDVTGSMSGSKITDLKAAAKDLIDIVVWDDQSEYTSKVAIIPFAQAVHLGSTTYVNNVRGTTKSGSCTSSSSPCTAYTSGTPSSTQWTWGAPASYYKFTLAAGGTATWRPSSYCVTERIGTNKFTDIAPTANANKVGPYYASSSSSESSRCSLVNTGDMEVNSFQPLSNDKVMLKRRIDKLTLAGSTAGQIGTAWAWYALSPNWAYLWPSANQPKAYHTDKLQKIAILMTDGEYNMAHCNGVLANDSDTGSNSSQINCNATNGQAFNQAASVCTAMKADTGITVYTVGFALGGSQLAINTLRNCASDETKFYNAEDGDALRLAFRDIALQIAKLRLSQ
jgi:Flp pilus assembly protein TadG